MNEIEQSLQYNFNNKHLLTEALTHSSISKDKNYEKLEFLGDSIINYFTTTYLLKKYPKDKESTLSIKRAQIVNQKKLCLLSKSLKLYNFIKIGKKITISERIHCDIFESLIGAIYTDSDINQVTEVLDFIFKKKIKLDNLTEHYDYKGLLISLYKKNKVTNFNIATHLNKEFNLFICQLTFNNLVFYGFAKNKKISEKKCSEFCYKQIESNL